MAKKKILTIGLSLASEETEFCEFDSETSLLDWDIVLFKPDISEYIFRRDSTFQGKPCLSDDESFKLKAQSEHWSREIKSAVDHGKLVIVFLSELQQVSIANGEKATSGTGRNQKVTRIVVDYDNYCSIPLSFKKVASKGREIMLTAKNSQIISSYWNEFSDVSSYKVTIESVLTPILQTKYGGKTVGAIGRSKTSSGALLCLPDIDFLPESFFVSGDDDEGDVWTESAKVFSSKFVKMIISLEKTLKSQGELTPEPDWATDPSYKLKQEEKWAQKLLDVEMKIKKLQVEKEAVLDQVREIERSRHLLFEKGKPLENAILDALKTIGFEVSQYNNGESEFDAVFVSKEGRLIGEVEGKDNKAINIEKLRQLSLNIHEDLEREEVAEPAKPVLFGNAYRLLPINDRPEPFTSKCISASSTSNTALIFTPDLFEVVKYLKDNGNTNYAMKCRKAILNAVGLVKFPDPPKKSGLVAEKGGSDTA